MPILNRVAELTDEVVAWRRHLHAIPELHFDLPKTSSFVADKLRCFGCDEVVTGLGKTGVVAIVEGSRGAGRTIALRADMDALPIVEAVDRPYASTSPGSMHACGHDGHTAMLLGAAKFLAETRNFAGKVVLIFQPDEEGGHGSKAMLDEGLMDRFAVEQVFGLHNLPGAPIGSFAIRNGALMAATTEFFIEVTGYGGHAASPHKAVDPVLVGTQIATAIYSIVSRTIDPTEAAVVSITKFHAGDALNVISEKAHLAGTIRTLNGNVAERIRQRISSICDNVGAAFEAKVSVEFEINAPVTFNHREQTILAADVAAAIVGDDKVDRDTRPSMGGEDFSYMLEARPGSFIYLGNGGSAPLHHPTYDFNDDAIPYGISYWIALAEGALSAPPS